MNKLCSPAFVYVLSESIINIYLLITGKLGLYTGFFKVLFIYLWILVLQYLYITLGWRIISWILVILPIITSVFFLVQSFVKDIANPENKPVAKPEEKKNING
jgi:hypothetical protein